MQNKVCLVKRREDSAMLLNGRLKGMELSQVPHGASVLAVAVFRLSRFLKSQVMRTVSDAGDIGLVSWRILMGLSLVDTATQRELVDFTRMEQAQLSRALKDMCDQGLIDSKPSETDRRARLFFLTEEGRATHQTLLPVVTRITDAIDAALSPEERFQFLEMCSRIERAASSAVTELPDAGQINLNPDSESSPEEVRT
ncbi:MarR family winged helix-turn-helix transcriptional regulator [Tritonibacter aquimaris]|nr:MarR family winged helix-turn-helix transcriptional regulator [Tritonibacter aquimaris]